jgi:hypothetical protein
MSKYNKKLSTAKLISEMFPNSKTAKMELQKAKRNKNFRGRSK